MKNNYSVFTAFICTAMNYKQIEIVAVDKEAAINDIMEAYVGVTKIELIWKGGA